MYRLIRYVMAIILLVCAIVILRSKESKIRILKAIACIIAFLIILIMPFENLFLRYNTPEEVFNRTVSNGSIINIVEKEKTALIIFKKDGSTKSTIVYKNNEKWKAPFLPNKQNLLSLDNNEIVMITKEKKESNFYIIISVSTGVKLITDNQGSNFQVYSSNEFWTDYVAYVENCTDNYIIDIDGSKYQLI